MTHPSDIMPALPPPSGRAAVLPAAHLSEVSDRAAAGLYVPRGAAHRHALSAEARPGVGAGARERSIGVADRPRRPSRRLDRLALALVTSGALIAGSARASDYDDALRAGVTARDRARESQFVSDWQRALEQLERAVALQDGAGARFELAEAAAALGRVDLAYESYEIALAQGLSAKAQAVARAYLDAHAADIARVEIDAPAGTLLSVDGRPRGRLPRERSLVVAAGQATIGLAPPDGDAWEQTLELEPGVVRHIALARATLTATPAGSRPAPTHAEHAVPAGSAAPPESEEPAWLGRHPGGIALLSVAGVSIAAGGWFAYKAHDSKGDAQDARSQIMSAYQSHLESNVVDASVVPCGSNGIAGGAVMFGPAVSSSDQQTLTQQYANACQLLNERQARTDRYTTLSMMGFGVGLAASAALLTWIVLSPSDAAPGSERRAQVTPLLSADTRGVLVEVEF